MITAMNMSLTSRRLVLQAFVGLQCLWLHGGLVAAADLAAGHLMVEDAEVYRLAPGERLFASLDFQWDQVPPGLEGSAAVRVELERTRPLAVQTTRPGRLLAVLWRWDYGFLEHGAQPLSDLNGWNLVEDQAGGIRDASPPFSSLPLYSFQVEPGRHELNLTEYFGQWVPVGFEADAQVGSTAFAPAVELTGSKTRHHVYFPGDNVVLNSDTPITGSKLYRKGELVSQADGDQFPAPAKPGRYWLQINFEDGSRIEPLTVGYGPVEQIGWPESFFPIGFYGVQGAPTNPNPKRLAELSAVAQFELGSNTFRTPNRTKVNTGGSLSSEVLEVEAFIDAIGARRIISMSQVRWCVREVESESRGVDVAMWEIKFNGAPTPNAPFWPNTLGFYVEDETPLKYAYRLGAIESEFQKTYPQLHLLYCLGGAAHAWEDAAVWRVAGSSVHMARSYPVRKGRDADGIIQRIRIELTDAITTWRTSNPEARFWLVPQVFGTGVRPPIWDPPTATQIRLMINLALARGTRGLTYFGFGSTPNGAEDLNGISRFPFVPTDDRYEEVGRINHKIATMSETLASLRWVRDIAQPNAEFDVQLLKHTDGREFVWITNWSYLEAREGTVDLRRNLAPINVSLAPGDSKLVDLGQVE